MTLSTNGYTILNVLSVHLRILGHPPSGNSTAEYIYFGGKRIARIGDGVIPIQNPSFETYNPLTSSCGTNCAYNLGPIPGWSGVGGSSQLTSAYVNLPLPNGNIIAYSDGGAISQTTGTTVQPNSHYTLSVYAGQQLAGYPTNYSVSLQAGSTVLATFNGSTTTIPVGEFVQQTLTYTSGTSVPSGDLTIVLNSAGLAGGPEFTTWLFLGVPNQNGKLVVSIFINNS